MLSQLTDIPHFTTHLRDTITTPYHTYLCPPGPHRSTSLIVQKVELRGSPCQPFLPILSLQESYDTCGILLWRRGESTPPGRNQTPKSMSSWGRSTKTQHLPVKIHPPIQPHSSTEPPCGWDLPWRRLRAARRADAAAGSAAGSAAEGARNGTPRSSVWCTPLDQWQWKAMASNLLAMASNLIVMASELMVD